MRRHFRGYQRVILLFFLGLSGMSLKEEQLSAIKAAYEGKVEYLGATRERKLASGKEVSFGKGR